MLDCLTCRAVHDLTRRPTAAADDPDLTSRLPATFI
jgi:hypothetical protein